MSEEKNNQGDKNTSSVKEVGSDQSGIDKTIAGIALPFAAVVKAAATPATYVANFFKALIHYSLEKIGVAKDHPTDIKSPPEIMDYPYNWSVDTSFKKSESTKRSVSVTTNDDPGTSPTDANGFPMYSQNTHGVNRVG